MYSSLDVKRACTKVLREAFPLVPVYDNDTVDGYERPSFFVEILTFDRRRESANLQRATFSYVITYFEVTHDEAECLRKYEAICEAFGPAVRVFEGSRTRIVIKDIGLSWIGTREEEHHDMLQVSVNFYESITLCQQDDDAALMEEITTDYAQKEI